MTDRYYATLGFGYEDLALDRGQVFAPRRWPRDPQLERLAYMLPLSRIGRAPIIYACGLCGSEFVGHVELAEHGAKRHAGARG